MNEAALAAIEGEALQGMMQPQPLPQGTDLHRELTLEFPQLDRDLAERRLLPLRFWRWVESRWVCCQCPASDLHNPRRRSRSRLSSR